MVPERWWFGTSIPKAKIGNNSKSHAWICSCLPSLSTLPNINLPFFFFFGTIIEYVLLKSKGSCVKVLKTLNYCVIVEMVFCHISLFCSIWTRIFFWSQRLSAVGSLIGHMKSKCCILDQKAPILPYWSRAHNHDQPMKSFWAAGGRLGCQQGIHFWSLPQNRTVRKVSC